MVKRRASGKMNSGPLHQTGSTSEMSLGLVGLGHGLGLSPGIGLGLSLSLGLCPVDKTKPMKGSYTKDFIFVFRFVSVL